MGTNKGRQFMTAVNQCEERCPCVWLISVRVLQSPASQSSLPEPRLASRTSGSMQMSSYGEDWSLGPMGLI